MILVFAVKLHWLRASGISKVGDGSLKDQVTHLIMPVTTLALATTGGFTRFVRASMIEVMRLDFVRTARAKGADERRVTLIHGFRNALIPVITVIALSFGVLFNGALITETMFAQPGMGKMIYDAILGNDYNLGSVRPAVRDPRHASLQPRRRPRLRLARPQHPRPNSGAPPAPPNALR
jgi:peptide/nickel transport system permease protein